MTTILAFIVVIGVLVFVHELGHFLVAKAADIRVPRFSIGLGPKVLGFRRGETEYVISALPLGGYVKMAGMEEMESVEGKESPEEGLPDPVPDPVTDAGLVGKAGSAEADRTFDSKSVPARALVISAGVLMNWLFAVVAFAVIALAWGIPKLPDARIASVDEELLPAGTEALARVPAGARIIAVGDRSVTDWRELEYALAIAPPGSVTIHFADLDAVSVVIPETEEGRIQLSQALHPLLEPRIGTVQAGYPADLAGLRPGDHVSEIAGEPISTWQEMVRVVESHPERTLSISVLRDGEAVRLTIVPRAVEDPATEEVVGRIGVTPTWRQQAGIAASVAYGGKETWDFTVRVVTVVRDLVMGRVSPRQLGGPIMIGQVSGETARAGLQAFLTFMAILSINLAVLNLLPIPVLDGGQLVFLAVEGIRGKALSQGLRIRLTQIGVALVFLLILLAVYNDVLRLFGL